MLNLKLLLNKMHRGSNIGSPVLSEVVPDGSHEIYFVGVSAASADGRKAVTQREQINEVVVVRGTWNVIK